MLKAVICAAAAVASAPAALAEPPQAPPPVVTVPVAPPFASRPIDAAALAEARSLLHDMDFEAQMERTATQAVNRTFDTMIHELQARLGEAPPPDLVARVRAVLMENTALVIAELRPTALDDAARIYARYFTADEIREIRRIQSNPVMIKVQRVTPELFPELMQIGVAASARHQAELEAELRRVVEQWQSEHAARRPHVG